VRIALHTGTPHLAEDGYVGIDVHRAARIAVATHALQAVLGRVCLWGAMVESEPRWRAERAYPAALYLPTLAPKAGSGRLARLLRRGQDTIPAADIAQGLSAYGVAVGLITGRTVAELADRLAMDPSLSLESSGG